jgi:MFS family permease
MLLGVALLVPSAVLLAAAQGLRSLAMLAVGAAVTGAAAALGYRGSLQVVNEIAPGEKRAEVISSYQIVCFLGNSLPVVGVGLLSAAATPLVATLALAACIAVLAAVALATELRRGR